MIGFAVMFIGLVEAVRTLVAAPSTRLAGEAVVAG